MTESTRELTTRAKQRVQAVGVYRPEEAAPQGGFLAVILAAAADPRCSVEKMQALLNMQVQIEERQAKKDFSAAFSRVQAKLPAIRRDGKIEIREKDPRTGSRETGKVQQSTPYATFNNIMKVVKPILLDEGLNLSFSTEPAGDRILVKGLLEGYGHQRETSFPLPAETSGSKNNVQGWGSSMSYGKRYCTIALLNIISEAIEDADSDGYRGNFKRTADDGLADVPEKIAKITAAQVRELWTAMEDAGVSEANFLTHYGLKTVNDLTADLFDAAIKALADHKAKKARPTNG